MENRIHSSGDEIGVSGAGGGFARMMEEARRSQIMDARPGPLLTANDIIKGRWKIIRKIGQGSFGTYRGAAVLLFFYCVGQGAICSATDNT